MLRCLRLLSGSEMSLTGGASALCGFVGSARHLSRSLLRMSPWTPSVLSTNWETQKSAAADR